MKLAQMVLIGALRCYRWIVSPIFNVVFTPMGFGCRFHPTCSQYALEAVRRHGAGCGTMLSIKRVCRCHPWGGCGCDPVPEWPGRLVAAPRQSAADCEDTGICVRTAALSRDAATTPGSAC